MATDRIRGSVNLPLTVEGHLQAQELANDIARKGGLHHITSSDMTRTQQTAMPIAAASGSHISVDPRLRDMAMGLFEGHESEKAIPEINKYITNAPNTPLPGKGIQSTTPGESFNTYKARIIPTIVKEAVLAKQNGERRGVVINRRSLKTVSAWLKAGAKDDLSTDTKEATGFDKNESTTPASMHHLDTSTNPPSLKDVDVKNPEPLKDGSLYLIRHATTAWNKESSLGSQDYKDKNDT